MCDQVVPPNFKGYILRKYAPPQKKWVQQKKNQTTGRGIEPMDKFI